MHKLCVPNHWVVGDPAYIRNDGTWEFFPQDPVHIMDYAYYREQYLAGGDYNVEIDKIVNSIIDTIVIVDGALYDMMNSPYN